MIDYGDAVVGGFGKSSQVKARGWSPSPPCFVIPYQAGKGRIENIADDQGIVSPNTDELGVGWQELKRNSAID